MNQTPDFNVEMMEEALIAYLKKNPGTAAEVMSTWLKSEDQRREERMSSDLVERPDGKIIAVKKSNTLKKWYSRVHTPSPKKKGFRKKDSEALERRALVARMRIEGKTIKQIAASLNPPITSQRVSQILKNIRKFEGLEFPKMVKKAEVVETKCGKNECEVIVTLPKRNFRGDGKHFCSKIHRAKYVNADGTIMSKLEKSRFQYHNLPGRKEKHKILVTRRHKERYATDPEYRRKLKEYQKAWLKRKKEDPLVGEKYRAQAAYQSREAWKKIKMDPERHEAYKKRQRERAVLRRAAQ